MGEQFITNFQHTNIIMNSKIVVLFAVVCAASGRVFLIDDGMIAPTYRVARQVAMEDGEEAEFYDGPVNRRLSPSEYELVRPASHAPKAHGKVGPVYTFVKTDPQANFKWGVRHVAG